jgi:hypothetical protein
VIRDQHVSGANAELAVNMAESVAVVVAGSVCGETMTEDSEQ